MILCVFIFCAGGCLCVQVHQSSDVITKPGDKAQIFCSNDQTDYRVMLWYQRSPGDTAMKLIGYLHYKTETMEEPYKDHFNITGDLSGNKEKNGSLIIHVKKPEQSAIYFCAASKAH
uniref:Immunoglobulin V-set domain-containing protein n=1 Tax=Sphaeramia orbicularis TaxID=375764 RepID=A0A673C550_9TELE